MILPENMKIEAVKEDTFEIGWIINTGLHHIAYYIYPSNRPTNSGCGVTYAFNNKNPADCWLRGLYREDRQYWLK